ncbi:hypothetical protein C447_09522 [Halococcus hamelinensis 100A6]|uniref:Uncharacterized protein n=2 Tax=Halococcus hamelinensis TaxID=332168 RepID=M0M1V7_9EURY|nr:hypothetical protein C447_09522 [Halococcus hamelinensis 100A6]
MSTSGEDGESTSMSTSEGEDSESTSNEEDSEDDSTATSESEDSDSGQDSDSTATSESEGSSGDSDGSSGDIELDEQDIVDGVTLDESEWYNEDSGISTGVRGQLTAEQDFDFLFINAQIYDSEGTRIGEGSDSSEGVSSGESLTFDCIMAPSDPSAVASYNIQISPDAM